MLDSFDWKYDAEHREASLKPFIGKLEKAVRDEYTSLWQQHVKAPAGRGDKTRLRQRANQYLQQFHDGYAGDNVYTMNPGPSDYEITLFATEQANRCRVYPDLDSMLELCAKCGVKPPEDDCTEQSAINRLRDFAWWRRRLRRLMARRDEQAAIDAGIVHVKADKYVSDDNIERLRQRHIAMQSTLESLLAVNEVGDSFTLADMQSRSVANPVNRRNELMCRLAGFETIANEQGYMADFYTVTTPSRFHARLSKTGKENPSYAGATPREGQKYLRGNWNRIRAKLARHNISYFGFRIAEPHHDGTPHWHMLLWVKPEHRFFVNLVMRRYALEDNPDEPGAKKYRIELECIDPAKGSAVGYVAKYISKNIDGFGMNAEDVNGAARVRAWASTWGIRQFQQVGGPPVGVWRELRRVRDGFEESLGKLNDAFASADAGDWAGYVRAQGGPTAPRKEQPISLHKIQTGEIGQYGDVMPPQVAGVSFGPVSILTRLHTWRITRNSKSFTPWSSVNNCTRANARETRPPGPDKGSGSPIYH